MANNRKQRNHGMGSDNRYSASPSCPPEAFDYDDDVTPDATAQLRAEAAEIMSKGKWVIIDGYVGDSRKAIPTLG